MPKLGVNETVVPPALIGYGLGALTSVDGPRPVPKIRNTVSGASFAWYPVAFTMPFAVMAGCPHADAKGSNKTRNDNLMSVEVD
jgi:hypothetical protein